MLFAACTTTAATPLQLTSHAANNLGQQQLTSLQQLKDLHVTSVAASSSSLSVSSSTSSSTNMPTPMHMSPQHQVPVTGATGKSAVAVAAAARANEEAKEAMRKLDATLVAYLAGETKLQPKQLEPKLELELNSSNDPNDITDEYVLEEFSDTEEDQKTVETITREELQLFRSIKSVKLQLEALTLEAEGTKRMELLQNEIRPIFTVECQLSHELIKHVPRYEMFHIMQFESEKFHSLTQCTRFGQEAQRDINLTPLIDELDYINGNLKKNASSGDAIKALAADTADTSAVEMPNFGRIHFTVWWREPGTCLNEMLGMGVFELRELYDAALLEQCKRITIQRRGVSLANIYLKINLLLCTAEAAAAADTNDTNNNYNSNNLSLGGGFDSSAIKQHHPNGGDKQQQQQQHQQENADTGSSTQTSSSSSSTAASSSTSSNTTANTPNPGDNNNVAVDTNINFNAATLKVRLLTGVINACEVRNMPLCVNREYHLVCERFWKSEPAASIAEGLHEFFYQEQFAIIRDANFLNCCKRNQLKLRILQRPFKSATNTEGNTNANAEEELQLVGVVSLPLKKFFIAFSNDMMANRMVTEKLPVIAIDDWVPIINEAKEIIGEMKCLLAIGSESQINYLKVARNLTPLHSDMFSRVGMRHIKNIPFPNKRMPSEDIQKDTVNVPVVQPKSIQRSTVDLMEMLQQALQQTRAGNTNNIQSEASALTSRSRGTNLNEALAASAQPMVRLNERTFQFQLNIECAAALPQNAMPKGKSGKNAAKRLASKRFPPGEAPTTYVTFQADMCVGSSGLYNSHEGKVYATEVVERNTNPRWAQRFVVTVSSEYLENPNQNFILKLWKKANVPPANGNFTSGNGGKGNPSSTISPIRLLPKPCDDAILGFTSLDLSVFLRGMHIGGIFNVIDFNGRINGQLYLNAKPTDGWYVRYLAQRISQHHPMQQPPKEISPPTSKSQMHRGDTHEYEEEAQGAIGGGGGGNSSIENVIEKFGQTLDLNLSQAVKHKYNELEGISKRLRARLSDVTGEELKQHLDINALENWLPFNDVVIAEQAMDNELDEFERDINTRADVVEDEQHTGIADIANANLVYQDVVIGDNDSDSNKNEQLISKTAASTGGAHDSAVD